MGLLQIAVLSPLALLLGWLMPRRRLAPALLLASLAALFWMQPATPLRGLDFWLPLASLALTAFAWSASLPAVSPARRASLPALALAAGAVALLSLTRYVDPLCCLTASRPPGILPTILTLLGVALLVSLPWLLPQFSRLFSWLGILLILGVFILLKTPALAYTVSAVWRTASGQNPALAAPSDVVWLGFSFLAFRLIHTLRDFQAGKLPELSFQDFAAYALFFPAAAAGPIDRLQRWQADLRAGGAQAEPALPAVTARIEALRLGAPRILIGMFKKFALADSLALIALSPQNAPQVQSAFWMWVLLIAYALRIYLDFSGYTDVAIGIGRLMGFRLPENFERPYWKTNLTGFWNSWHITLAQWFRAYVFNPLLRWMRTRPRKLPAGMMVLTGQLTVMTLIGLWHGVTWNFLIWGLWHGLGLFAHNRWSEWTRPRLAWVDERPNIQKAMRAGGWLLTFLYVSLGWVWFALPDVDMALGVFRKLFGF